MVKGDLTGEQWGLLESLLPSLPHRPDGRGRPWKDSRAVLNPDFPDSLHKSMLVTYNKAP
jgi:hypothetical protein